jgi:hypothetical protein
MQGKGKWLFGVAILVAGCCVLGAIINAVAPKTPKAMEVAAPTATWYPTMTVKVPTEAPIVVPTKMDGTCTKAVIGVWGNEMSAVMTLVVQSAKAGQKGDFTAGAVAITEGLKMYQTVQSPDCDKDAATIHKSVGVILTLYGDAFIQINKGNMADAKADIEVATALIKSATTDMAVVLDKYK